MVAQLPISVSAPQSPTVFTCESVDYFIPSRLDARAGTYRVPCPFSLLQLNYPLPSTEPERTVELRAALAKVDAELSGQIVPLSPVEFDFLYLRGKISFTDLVTYQLERYADLPRVRSYFETLPARPVLRTGIVEVTFALDEITLLRQVAQILLSTLLGEDLDYLRLDFESFTRRKKLVLNVDVPREYHLAVLQTYARTVEEYLAAK